MMRLETASREPIFRLDGDRVIPSPDAAGPWDPGMQHGSAPAALVVWVAEQVPTAVPMHIVRVTVDLMRPVPIAPLTVETEVLREGRKIQLCAVRLLAAGTVVVSASVLKSRAQKLELPSGIGDLAVDVPGPGQSAAEPGDLAGSPFIRCISMRAARGRFGGVGPAAIWFRVDQALIEGAPVSPATRALVAADFSNGVSAALDFRNWTFINADLTVSFARQPVGDWILVDGESWIGPNGSGLAMARLADERGYFGRSVQSLVVERR